MEDLLVKGTRADCTSERDQEAVLGHLHLVLALLHRSDDVKYYVGVVVDYFGVVGDRKGVFSALIEKATAAAAAAAAAGGGGFTAAVALSFLLGFFGRGFTLGGLVA